MTMPRTAGTLRGWMMRGAQMGKYIPMANSLEEWRFWLHYCPNKRFAVRLWVMRG